MPKDAGRRVLQDQSNARVALAEVKRGRRLLPYQQKDFLDRPGGAGTAAQPGGGLPLDPMPSLRSALIRLAVLKF